VTAEKDMQKSSDDLTEYRLGRIDQASVKELCFAPAADTAVFVCGVPAFYDSVCGPRGEAGIQKETFLSNLGY